MRSRDAIIILGFHCRLVSDLFYGQKIGLYFVQLWFRAHFVLITFASWAIFTISCGGVFYVSSSSIPCKIGRSPTPLDRLEKALFSTIFSPIRSDFINLEKYIYNTTLRNRIPGIIWTERIK